MGLPWKRIGIGLKVVLGVAIKLNDAHVIQVKGLKTAKTVKEIVEGEISAAKPNAYGSSDPIGR